MIDVILTCGVVIGSSLSDVPKLCGEPASFRYTGLVPLRHNENQTEAIRLRGRIVVDECMDHTRETLIRMEPALKEHSATMRCLVQTRLTIRCDACHSVFRFEPVAPTVHKAPGRFCPNCGIQATSTTNDPALDYWELISQALNLPPTLVQQI